MQHGFVDGRLRQHGGGEPSGDAEAADAQEGFVRIDFRQGLQGKFANQCAAALVNFPPCQDDRDLRIVGAAQGVGVVCDHDDMLVFQVVQHQEGRGGRIDEDGVPVLHQSRRVAGNGFLLLPVHEGPVGGAGVLVPEGAGDELGAAVESFH